MSSRFEALADAVAPKVLLDAVDASRRLSELGVPHALIGGLAVGVHGHPRATKDVDGADTSSVTRYLRDHAPELVARFAELVPSADDG
jgi:hypothetical protein